MPLVIQENNNDYPVAPEGLANGVCVDIVDLGVIETKFGPKHKISIVFELDSATEEGRRFVVSKRYTKSLNEKSNLRQDLEKWRGRKFTAKELKDGFDMESLLGISATIYVSHNETEQRTYANIESILPPEKGDDGTVNWLGVRPSGDYVRVVNREAKEYAESA